MPPDRRDERNRRGLGVGRLLRLIGAGHGRRRHGRPTVDAAGGPPWAGSQVGSGDGANFAHYPSTVEQVLAIDPEVQLRGLSQAAAARAPVPVEVHAGTAELLPAADASMHAVVFAMVRCSVPDQQAALAEAVRPSRHKAASPPAARRILRGSRSTLFASMDPIDRLLRTARILSEAAPRSQVRLGSLISARGSFRRPAPPPQGRARRPRGWFAPNVQRRMPHAPPARRGHPPRWNFAESAGSGGGRTAPTSLPSW
ncbi:methyltransferase domain-containing protein [Actinopolymorpha pittospori]|uniref:Methyltransferase type 11 domain-containing protein n=1 Tax=Actinopolymorpha pittospori TaxID=648752 RepID=A0A927MNL8_9ACTN|nr:hypothetical protein [Actinopolymorpha pittospori]